MELVDHDLVRLGIRFCFIFSFFVEHGLGLVLELLVR